ncbi:PREDICTED: putative tripartite motif-containing protein 75 [Dipodomys ordii]|uniref:Tripartite motif-containing protein 75 n=1 Tax=Dipodomys ordii TaxID=10020 RepID=A0A1S3FSS0_DIPOR|nr:PREDICTED: putative tripartite motif-containing protein 75 [Dipodomys ordii]
MACAASLAELQAQATCPICLAYLSDPVTTECGHNFCHSCILQCWEGLQDTFPCPTCLHYCPNDVLHSNTQLSHLVDIVMRLAGSESKRQLCEQHGEVLSLFCDDDLQLLCAQCRVSSDHHQHHLMPISEAAAAQKEKLNDCKKHLKRQARDAKTEYQRQISKSIQLIPKIQKWKEELQSEFRHFQHFMSSQCSVSISRLYYDEKTIETQLLANTSEILEHLTMLKSLLSEMKEKTLQADVDLLRGVRSLQERYTAIHPPRVFSYELMENNPFPPHYFGLEKMMSTFRVDLTFNPQFSHPVLKVSQDRKTVTLVGQSAPSPFSAMIHTQERLQNGRFFWQVEVKGTGHWSMGVFQKSASKDLMVPCFKRESHNITQHTQSSLVDRVGAFLDYELGELSFYDLKCRSCLHVFNSKFTGALVPFFSMRCISPSFLSISFD